MIHLIFTIMSGIGFLGIFVTMLTTMTYFSCSIPKRMQMTNRLGLSAGLLILGILGPALLHAL